MGCELNFGFEGNIEDLGSERPDLRSERPDLRCETPDLGPHRPDKRLGGEEAETLDQKNCPVWNHRLSTPPRPLPKNNQNALPLHLQPKHRSEEHIESITKNGIKQFYMI